MNAQELNQMAMANATGPVFHFKDRHVRYADCGERKFIVDVDRGETIIEILYGQLVILDGCDKCLNRPQCTYGTEPGQMRSVDSGGV